MTSVAMPTYGQPRRESMTATATTATTMVPPMVSHPVTMPKVAIQHPHMPAWMMFGIAGGSGISAWMFVHPFDVIKVRMQMMGAHGHCHVPPIVAAKNIVATEGSTALYKGLSAGLMRQGVYTTLRLGLYDEIKEMIHETKPGHHLNVLDRAAIGLSAGGIASFISCPVEVCLVRMQADGSKPVEQRRNYTGMFNAMSRIGAEEGLTGFWKGASPTVYRAMVVSMTQLGTYDQAKEMMIPHLGDGHVTHLSAAVAAAVVYSFASLPLDTAKTRMQSQHHGEARYRSTLQTIAKIARKEGPLSLWKGFTPYFARSGMHTVLMFMFKELYTSQAEKHLPPPTHEHGH